MRTVLILSLLISIYACAALPSQKPNGEAERRNGPLYEDSTGWQITQAKRIEAWAEDYMSRRAQGLDFGRFYAALRYVYDHDPSQYAMLFLALSDDMVLTWTPDSRMVLHALSDGDTATFLASQIMVTNEGRLQAGVSRARVLGDRIWISARVYRDDPEPTRYIRISKGHEVFTTEKGSVILFARFEWGRNVPDKPLWITVTGVETSKRR